MIGAALLAIAFQQLQQPFPKTAVTGSTFWALTVADAKGRDYTPELRFFPQSSFMFTTPDFVMQGTYTVRNNHYWFRAVTAFEIENSDVAHLKEDMDPQSALKFAQAYARSMQNFEGDYNGGIGTLYVTYPVKGIKREFGLHPYTEGDDTRDSALHDDERGLAGLWQGYDDYPERLDSRTRYKIGGLEGLQRFFREAMESDGGQMMVIDLRVDHSYRFGSEIGNWKLDGRTVILRSGTKQMDLTLNDKGQLTQGGKPTFVR